MCDLLPGIIPQPGKKFAPNASGYGTPCACQSWVLRPGFSMAREVFYLGRMRVVPVLGIVVKRCT